MTEVPTGIFPGPYLYVENVETGEQFCVGHRFVVAGDQVFVQTGTDAQAGTAVYYWVGRGLEQRTSRRKWRDFDYVTYLDAESFALLPEALIG